MKDVDSLLRDTVKGLESLLGTNLVGVYLHGSLAMGSFHPKRSDVDFLVVVNEKLSKQTKQKVANWLIELSEDAPPSGLEMSIVLKKYLDAFEYPTPFEFHFGKEQIEKFRTGKIDLETQETDKDLAAHFVVTYERGRALCGVGPKEIFPVVPPQNYFDSLMADIEWWKRDMKKAPIYGISNLCRVLAYAKEGIITSKVEGIKWAIQNLDQQFHPLIKRALITYESTTPIERPWDEKELQQFADDMVSKIETTWKERRNNRGK